MERKRYYGLWMWDRKCWFFDCSSSEIFNRRAFLCEFYFSQTILTFQTPGVDNSASMLKVFRRKAKELDGNVNCWAPEAFTLSKETVDHLEGRKFDLIVTSMVLHHVPSPQEILQVLASLLKEGGYIAVIDFDTSQLNPHALGTDEERNAKGVHHPHGFSIESMTQLFSGCGITVTSSHQFKISKQLLLHHPDNDQLPPKDEGGDNEEITIMGCLGQARH
jgi:SAM-dependent methyltransferase